MQLSPKLTALFHQFLRFAAVGLSGTLVQYACLWIGVNYFLMNAAIASAIGYILGSVVNYVLNYFFTFGSQKSHKEAATKYFSLLGVGWCINFGLMILFHDYWGWHLWLAQIITTGIGLIWNFSGSKWWAFKHKTH